MIERVTLFCIQCVCFCLTALVGLVCAGLAVRVLHPVFVVGVACWAGGQAWADFERGWRSVR